MRIFSSKRIKVCIFLCVAVLMLVPACSKHKQEKTADQLADEGRKSFEKKNYKDAIASYEKLKDWYPFSKYAKEAELKVADAHYQLKQYDEAIVAYREYSQLHPSDPKAAYVLYQVARCYYDQMEPVDRDQTATINAIDAFRNLIVAFPDSEYTKEANESINEGLKKLAEKDMYVGKFYFKSRHYKAALARFQSVVNNYPDFGLYQEANDYIQQCQSHIAEITGSGS